MDYHSWPLARRLVFYNIVLDQVTRGTQSVAECGRSTNPPKTAEGLGGGLCFCPQEQYTPSPEGLESREALSPTLF